MPLTDTAIRKAKPADKVQRLFDAGGLYLEITKTGCKWWRLKYLFDGKEKRLPLTGHSSGESLHKRNAAGPTRGESHRLPGRQAGGAVAGGMNAP